MGNQASCSSPSAANNASPPDFRPFTNFSYNDALKLLGRPVAVIGADGLPSAPPDDLHLSAGEYTGAGNNVDGHQTISQIANVSLHLRPDHTLLGSCTQLGVNGSEVCNFRNGEWLNNGWIAFNISFGTEDFRYRGIFDVQNNKFIGKWHIMNVEGDSGIHNEIRRKTGAFNWKLTAKERSSAAEGLARRQSLPSSASEDTNATFNTIANVPKTQQSAPAPAAPPSALPPDWVVVPGPPPPPPPIPSQASLSRQPSDSAQLGYPGAVAAAQQQPSQSVVIIPVAQPAARPSRPEDNRQSVQPQNNNNDNNSSGVLGGIFGRPSLGINFGMPLTGRGFRPWAALGGNIPINLPK